MQAPSALELEQLTRVHDQTCSPFESIAAFQQHLPMAEFLARSTVVPEAYQGNPANCLLAVDVANRANMSVLSVFQNLLIINGKPAWTGKFVIATLNSCGKFEPLQYESKGEEGSYDYAVRAVATSKVTGERVEGVWVSYRMVVDSGWLYEGSPWNSKPDLMYIYRAASFFGSVNAPEILLGIPTDDEARDISRTQKAAATPLSFPPSPSTSGASKRSQPNRLSLALREVEVPPAPQVLVAPAPLVIPKPSVAQPKARKKAKDVPPGPSLFDGFDAGDAAALAACADTCAAEPAVPAAQAESTLHPTGTVPDPSPSAAPTNQVENSTEEHCPDAVAEVGNEVPPVYFDQTEPTVEAAQEPAPPAPVSLAIIQELCLRANSTIEIVEVAKQLVDVTPAELEAAECEVLQTAMTFMADETSLEAMEALKLIHKALHGANKQVFRAAYNGRCEELNRQSTN